MDIGNGNIASVRLAAISARIGTLVSEKIHNSHRNFKCEQIRMRKGMAAASNPWCC